MRLAAAALALGLSGAALADDGRPLKLETIDQVIEHSDRAVQACHTRARRDTLAVLVSLEIDASGAVASATPADKVTSESQCLVRVARRLHFPATGVTTSVVYPFMLAPQLRR